MIVVNLYGGPGTGKSTTAAGVFSKLKLNNINAELVTEYAKDIVWEGSYNKLNNQVYIFGKQFQRIDRLNGKLDVVVTDSPILLSIIYNRLNINQIPREIFDPLVEHCYNQFDNINYFLVRKKPFNQSGRLQNEAESIQIDYHIQHIALINKPYITIDANEEAINDITIDILKRLGKQ